MSQSATITTTLVHRDEEGEEVRKQTHSRPTVLAGYSRPEFRYYTVAPDGTISLDVTDAVALVCLSRDEAFSFKLNAADSAQLDNQTQVSLVGNNPSDASLGANVAPQLLGNGSTTASVEVWTVRN